MIQKWLELVFCLQLQASSVLSVCITSASLDARHMALCKTGAAHKSGGKAKGKNRWCYPVVTARHSRGDGVSKIASSSPIFCYTAQIQSRECNLWWRTLRNIKDTSQGPKCCILSSIKMDKLIASKDKVSFIPRFQYRANKSQAFTATSHVSDFFFYKYALECHKPPIKQSP